MFRSGKSNILDAICFLLGITNLSHVRAANLQELVYKNGQAGVTKATVSITFDNRDKKQSPLGYEHYDEVTITRQVVIGGKNKYLINGSNVQNNRVQDFFRSVQLNVNNPHFLIMQGRITKVNFTVWNSETWYSNIDVPSAGLEHEASGNSRNDRRGCGN